VTSTGFLIGRSNYRVTWVEVCILIIAVFIGVAAFLATLITCCLYDRWLREGGWGGGKPVFIPGIFSIVVSTVHDTSDRWQ
jgi:hypothetical protein